MRHCTRLPAKAFRGERLAGLLAHGFTVPRRLPGPTIVGQWQAQRVPCTVAGQLPA